LRLQIKKYINLFLVTAILCLPQLTFASVTDFIYNVRVLSETNEVVIEGNVPSVYTGAIVSCQVINPGRSNAELDGTVQMKDVVNYVEDCVAGENGTFSFRYVISGTTGLYNIVIGVSGRQEPYTGFFNYYSGQYESKVISDINLAKAAKDAAKFEELFKANYSTLNLNCTLYNQLSAQGKDLSAFYKLMADSKQINSVNELQAQADEMMVVYLINSAETGAETAELLKTYGDVIGIVSSTAYYTYSNGGVSADVCGELAKTDFSSKSAIVTAFQNQTIRMAVYKANGWEPVRIALLYNKVLIDIDDTKLNKLKSPSEVFRMMAGNNYMTLSEVNNAFNKAVADEYDIENTDKTGGGGGGGSKSSGSGNYSIAVVPSNTAPQSNGGTVFSDMKNVEWAIESVEALYKKGIVKGKSDITFAPNDPVTREEFVKMLVMSLNIFDKDAKTQFNDVSSSEWYAPYIASAVNTGIINGKANGNFGVGEQITREDMAAVVYRALLYKNSGLAADNAELSFTDSADIADYAVSGVAFMQEKQLIRGNGDGRFSPKENSTRAQAAVIINRLLEFLVNV